MDFTEAMKSLEQGKKIKRPNWSGYLFLDIDGHIKHVGIRGKGEKFWSLDTDKPDWEIRTKETDDDLESADMVEIESHEITQSRLETMMDATACHIKRLYYLEEIIAGQHKAMKAIADNLIVEMEETRRSLSKSAGAVPRIESTLKDLQSKFYKLELSEMVKSYKQITKSAEQEKKEEEDAIKETEKEDKKASLKQSVPIDMKPAEVKEMEEVREKYNTRLAMKAKTAVKTGKKAKKD